MDRKKFFKKVAYLVIFIAFLNYVAVKLYWYTSIWYFDMIMHFLGGFWLGLALFYLFFTENISKIFIFKIILGVLIIGAFWEGYEILVNNNFAQIPFNLLDTLSDIFFDLTGGLCAILYIWEKQLK
jgi:hypothetical protein